MALERYRIGEEERKMREAALNLNFEQAIVHRDKYRQLVAEFEKAEEAKPKSVKVVDIKTKGEFVLPEDEAVPEAPAKEPNEEPDEDVIALLDKLKEVAQLGGIRAIAVMMGFGKEDDIIEVDHVMTGRVLDHVRMFVGGAHTFSADLLAIEAELNEEVEDD